MANYTDYIHKRGSGVLLHITSLPSPHGIGDLGTAAYDFADFLADTKQTFWQVLPLNPTNLYSGNSPYSSISAFAGNTNLISPDLLIEDGLLAEKDIKDKRDFSGQKCDYAKVTSYKEDLLSSAYKNFEASKKDDEVFRRFCSENARWLEDFAIFAVMRNRFGKKPWNVWDKRIKDRDKAELKKVAKKYSKDIARVKFTQYVFFKQWFSLKDYCNQKGIRIIGDMPIYVSYDSSDVWSHPDIFKLDNDKQPTHVAGVPPDYFSPTGQLWGNPVYQWEALRKRDFDWWVDRMAHNFKCFDIVRIDHFRGLVAYWEVAKGEETAVNGAWIDVPVKELIDTLINKFHSFPVIAEDLGMITDDVREIVKHYKLPGMKILLFAFGEDNSLHPYLPHNYDKNWVVYTGTHDNNTSRGWFEKEARQDEKERLFRYVGRSLSAEEVPRELLRLAMMSVANIALFPLQDILGLGAEARMNIPSVAKNNWEWRFSRNQINEEIKAHFSGMTEIYSRRSRKD